MMCSSSEDYESQLAVLWGRAAHSKLTLLVAEGQIEDYMVENFARHREVRLKVIYDEHYRRQLPLQEILERILLAWYNKRLYRLRSSPIEAQELLVNVMKESRFPNRIVDEIRDSFHQDQETHELDLGSTGLKVL